jgi:hypothetical protein
MTTRQASCSCGQLRVTTHSEPVRVSICHCHACQRRTGSVFGVQARFKGDTVEIVGESKEFARTGDSGNTARFQFCPNCGATVYYRFDSIPDVVALPVGVFADAAFPMPNFSVYEARMHSWVSVPEHIEHLD